jgi:hypothetical protein
MSSLFLKVARGEKAKWIPLAYICLVCGSTIVNREKLQNLEDEIAAD